MEMETRDKRVAGGLVFDPSGKFFLGKSHKWHAWVVPGGELLPEETPEAGFIREIQEELNITITELQLVGEKIKEPSKDFHKEHVRFYFYDFIAQASEEEIAKLKTNDEFDTHDWFSFEEALSLELVDSVRQLIIKVQKMKARYL